MLNRIIRWSLQNRLIVLVLAGLLIFFGIRTARESPLDVFPDFAPPQVVIQTEAQGLSPEEVEQLVSLPLENALNGTADLETIRSSSIAGLSVITCIFTSGTDSLGCDPCPPAEAYTKYIKQNLKSTTQDLVNPDAASSQS